MDREGILVLPVLLLNFPSIYEVSKARRAGLLKAGLEWNAGGFLTQNRKTILGILKGILQTL